MSALDHAGMRFGSARPQTPANAFADTLLHVVLYITLLSSFFVIVEPAPYEYLAAVLGFACVLARVPLPRLVLPLLVLLLIRDAAGAIGLLKILEFGMDETPGRSNRSSRDLRLSRIQFVFLRPRFTWDSPES